MDGWSLKMRRVQDMLRLLLGRCPFCTAGGANTLPQTPSEISTEEESPHSWENKLALDLFKLCTHCTT